MCKWPYIFSRCCVHTLQFPGGPIRAMASLSVPINPLPPPVNRRPDVKPEISLTAKERDEEKRREKVNRKIASQKATSMKLRSEAAKAVIGEKSGPSNSQEPLPLLENLRAHIAALRWESALNVSHFPLPFNFFFFCFALQFLFNCVRVIVLLCLYELPISTRYECGSETA